MKYTILRGNKKIIEPFLLQQAKTLYIKVTKLLLVPGLDQRAKELLPTLVAHLQANPAQFTVGGIAVLGRNTWVTLLNVGITYLVITLQWGI